MNCSSEESILPRILKEERIKIPKSFSRFLSIKSSVSFVFVSSSNKLMSIVSLVILALMAGIVLRTWDLYSGLSIFKLKVFYIALH